VSRPSIAIMHYTCPPVVGGVEQLIAIHAGMLADRGYPTMVVTGKGEPFRPDVPVVAIPHLYSKDLELLKVNSELERGTVSERFFAMVEGIYGALRRTLRGVEVCVVHNAFTLHFNLPLTAALWRLVESGEAPRIVGWCHDLAWRNNLYIPLMRDEYPWALLKRPLDGVKYVVVSELRQRELSELFGVSPDQFAVVPAGVDPESQLKLERETAELVRRLGLLDGDLLMLAPVRITKRKNLEMSLRIVHALAQKGVDARLVVTGPPGPHNVRSGDYVEELRDLRHALGIEREVVLLFEQVASEGSYPVSDRMMCDLYSISDLLLFSSAQEGFGIPLIEAGLFRLPVFCTNIPPFREIGLGMVHYFELDEEPASVADRIRRWMVEDRVYCLRRRVLKEYWWDSIFSDRIEPLMEGR